MNDKKFTETKTYEVSTYDYDNFHIGMDKALAVERLQDSTKGKVYKILADSLVFDYKGNSSALKGLGIFIFKNNVLNKIYSLYYPDSGPLTKILFEKGNQEIRNLHGDPTQTIIKNEAVLDTYLNWQDLLAGVQKSEVELSAKWNTHRITIENKLTTISFDIPNSQYFPAIIQILKPK